MLKRPVIEREYVDNLREIHYLGSEDEILGHEGNPSQGETQDNVVTNNSHCFKVLSHKDSEFPESSEFGVIGWIERTVNMPYDFILADVGSGKHYIANLHGRSDGWPLFAMQNGRPTCSRTRLGSKWNCRLCVKYFGTVCKPW